MGASWIPVKRREGGGERRGEAAAAGGRGSTADGVPTT